MLWCHPYLPLGGIDVVTLAVAVEATSGESSGMVAGILAEGDGGEDVLLARKKDCFSRENVMNKSIQAWWDNVHREMIWMILGTGDPEERRACSIVNWWLLLERNVYRDIVLQYLDGVIDVT